jgi:hypothetical protein
MKQKKKNTNSVAFATVAAHIVMIPCTLVLPIALARFRFQFKPCMWDGGQSYIAVGFLRVHRFRLPIVIPPIIILCNFMNLSPSRETVSYAATAYGLDDQGVRVRVPVGSRIFSSPRRRDRFWAKRRNENS